MKNINFENVIINLDQIRYIDKTAHKIIIVFDTECTKTFWYDTTIECDKAYHILEFLIKLAS